MRNFLSSMLGALAALVIFTAAGVLLFSGFLLVISAIGQKPVAIETDSFAVFDLSANITDGPPMVDFSALTGNRPEVLQLRALTKGIRAAATDDRIKGILIIGSLRPSGYGSGYAALWEVRSALLDFKRSQKPIKAYLTNASTRDYFLASVADDVALDPYGMIFMPGLASESMFFANAFKKYGIGVQVTRVGKYKSAIEPFVREELSPESREQSEKLLGDVWRELLGEIGASRGRNAEQLQTLVDREGLFRAEVALKAGLVDRVVYRDVVLDELKTATGVVGSSEPFKQINLANYLSLAPKTRGNSSQRVAVVYAEGEIVDGEGEVGLIGGDDFSRELRRLRENRDVKAIVLRVNSPGGSAAASEMIQREMRLTAKVKPVVVSMGSYAASGGYWISTFSDRIFAEPTTITGSIGVFGVFFDVRQLAGDFGVTFDRVKTGKFADAFTISRPKTEAELTLIQNSVDWIYDQFVGKVVESRKLKREFVEEIAQGRVWSGTEALQLGLVDELGGLDAAIEFAAAKAKLGDGYSVSEYPRKKDLGEAFAEMLERLRPAGARLGVYDGMLGRLEAEMKVLRSFNDPQGLYLRMPVTISIQ